MRTAYFHTIYLCRSNGRVTSNSATINHGIVSFHPILIGGIVNKGLKIILGLFVSVVLLACVF
ncbi:MAG TPA: hypothetical protein PLR65_00520, partial [Anaerolineales bacterium]|nr:hypothetical protein [Anaerolineales bacterium]